MNPSFKPTVISTPSPTLGIPSVIPTTSPLSPAPSTSPEGRLEQSSFQSKNKSPSEVVGNVSLFTN
jgi:hypothetical protein